MAGPVPEIEGFEDLTVIGRGGFSTVYRASQPSADRHVAIKVVDAVLDDATRQRFERECRALGALAAHPGICTLYSFGRTADDHPYLVLELCARSLAERVRAEGPLGVDEAVQVLATLADAIAAVHDRGIVHRDIKPENVLETQFGRPVLTDFGIARMADGFHTTSGMVTASLAHAAPEVLDGDEPTAASDLWSLASTGYELLTGEPPFKRAGEPNSVLITRVFRDPPPDLREHGVPDGVAAVLERGLAKDPADRLPDLRAFAAALLGDRPGRAAVTEPVPQDRPRRTPPPAAPPTSTLTPPLAAAAGPPPGGRRRALLGLGALAAVGLGVAGALLLLDDGEGPQASGTTSTTVASTTTADLRPRFCVVDVDLQGLTVRRSPGLRNSDGSPKDESDIVGLLPEGTCTVRDAGAVQELQVVNGVAWRRIDWLGLVGWAADPYLQPT